MGIASMVIGIISLIVGFIPFCGMWVVIPALAGIGLGIAELLSRSNPKKNRGMAIAGLVLNPLAIIIVAVWWVLLAIAANGATQNLDATFQQQMRQGMQTLQDYQNRQQNPPSPNANPSAPPSPGMEPMQPMDPAPPPSPETPPSDTAAEHSATD